MYLEVDNVGFFYEKERKILDNISFRSSQGETVAIVGASGCGKSTLLRLIAGIIGNDPGGRVEGTIMIDGVTSDQFRRSGKLAFMFQEATLMPNLTVRQNIELPLNIKKTYNKNKVDNLIDIVGLSKFASKFPGELSGGMKTRVSLARSFVTEPKLLLLDEPFSALDIAWKDALYHELVSLKNTYNTSVVIVTHDIAESIELSSKIIALGMEGKMLMEENVTYANKENNQLHKLIENVIIQDHKLKKRNEKEDIISYN